MAILIKGMEMPENCDRCKLVRYFGMAGGIECLAKKEWPATSYANEDFRESGTRPDWCPLVEVTDEQPDRNAQERYEDLCEYFKDCSDKGMGILGDRKEFKAWLERVHWHVVRCDELGRELEKLQSAQPERKRGTWYKPTGVMPPEHFGRHRCSECDGFALHDWKHHKEQLTDFCPYCGCKMER